MMEADTNKINAVQAKDQGPKIQTQKIQEKKIQSLKTQTNIILTQKMQEEKIQSLKMQTQKTQEKKIQSQKMQVQKIQQYKVQRQKAGRLAGLDTIRGITLLSMMLYHTCWDLVFLFGKKIPGYSGFGGYVWQQSICWTFILLAGFCWSLGSHHLKRGLIVFGSGILITFVTLLVMPESRVIFGVLTLIGSCMLLLIPMEKLLLKLRTEIGLAGSFLLFLLFRNVNTGYLGFENWNILNCRMVFMKICSPPILDFHRKDFLRRTIFHCFRGSSCFLQDFISISSYRKTT